MKRITVNGVDLDLYPNDRINLNINLNDISDISTRNSTFSNTIRIPKTSKNIKTFEFLGVIGNTSNTPYEKVRCNYFVDDLPLINDGYLQITKTTNKEFHIVLYDGILDLAERIKGKYLTDLSIAETLSHTRTQQVIIDSLENEEDYIYALGNYVEGKNFSTNSFSPSALYTADESMPCIYVITVFKAILDDAGYEYEGELFSNEDLLNEVFTMGKGTIGSTIDFTDVLPRVTQVKFIKDILIRYGQIIHFVDGKLLFLSFDSVLTGSQGIVDFTDKLISIKQEQYKSSKYAQINNFKFIDEDKPLYEILPELPFDFYNGSITINNEFIAKEKDFYESIYTFTQISSVGIANPLRLIPKVKLYSVEPNTTPQFLKSEKRDISLFKIKNEVGVNNTVRDTATSNYTIYNNSEARILDNQNINWTYYLTSYYSKLEEVLQNFKSLKITLNLNSIDLYNLDLTKLIYLQQTGKYYYVSKVSTNGIISKADVTEVTKLIQNNEPVVSQNIIIESVENVAFTYVAGFSTQYNLDNYNGNNLTIIYTQLNEENGIPTGLIITDDIDLNEFLHTQPFPFQPDTCGWWSVEIIDTTLNISSNTVQILSPCLDDQEPDTTPSISIYSYFYEQDAPASPTIADVGYSFNNFTPSFATMTIQNYGIVTQEPFGEIHTYNLTDLTQDVQIRLEDLTIPGGEYLYFKRVIITTDTLSKSVVIIL